MAMNKKSEAGCQTETMTSRRKCRVFTETCLEYQNSSFDDESEEQKFIIIQSVKEPSLTVCLNEDDMRLMELGVHDVWPETDQSTVDVAYGHAAYLSMAPCNVPGDAYTRYRIMRTCPWDTFGQLINKGSLFKAQEPILTGPRPRRPLTPHNSRVYMPPQPTASQVTLIYNEEVICAVNDQGYTILIDRYHIAF